MNYVVVFETMKGLDRGIVTFSSYLSKEEFRAWYAGNMRDGTNQPISAVYKVIAEDVSEADAIRICHERREEVEDTVLLRHIVHEIGPSIRDLKKDIYSPDRIARKQARRALTKAEILRRELYMPDR